VTRDRPHDQSVTTSDASARQ